jgi:hypothetical protein
VPARDSDDLGGAAKPYKTGSLRPLGSYRAFIAREREVLREGIGDEGHPYEYGRESRVSTNM